MRVGAIDVGSNSIRLLVAEIAEPSTGSGLVTLARAGEVCRLARGLDRTGIIDLELAERAGSLAADFLRRARSLGASHVVIGATAALRKASNGGRVAEVIRGRTGLPVRVLTGHEEARLVYRSVVAGLGRLARRSACVIFDVGGGSTEIVSGLGPEAGRWASLPVGAVNMTERHLVSDPPAASELEALRGEVRELLMQICTQMPKSAPVLAGVGGTVTALGMLDRDLETYEPQLLEGWRISPQRLGEWIGRLSSLPLEERRAMSPVGEGRADILPAGAAIVGEIFARFPSTGLVCSTQGLRYGLARLAAEEASNGSASAP
jgi:exopolyphosphatase / guanosine-5'-triphosphate,3'-diphosphate pyrophosphatase